MSVYARAAEMAVGRLPGVDDHRRADIASTLRALAAESPRTRWRELGSVLWLSRRLRSRADTDDRPTPTWRQGFHRGGTLLVATCAVEDVGLLATHPAGTPAVVAGALVAATWAAARGRVVAAAALVLPAAVAFVTEVAPRADATPFALRCVVGLAALAVSAAPARDGAALCPWLWMALVAAGSAAAATGEAASDVVVVALTLAVPIAWLASARADPRLAVGAAVALFWRLVAVDLHELGDALVAVPAGRELDLLLVRWVVMAAGVVAAVVVARSSIRRAAMI